MAGLFFAGIDILKTTLSSTGRILAQVGSVVGMTVDANNVEMPQQVGFVSRASKALIGKAAAQGWGVRLGGIDFILATQDARGIELAGNLREGEATVYAAGADGTGQARTLYKDDGSINTYTTDTNTADGKAVYARTAPDEFKWVAPWGTMTFDATGFHVVTASGASFSMGGIGGLPPPLDALSSYIKLEAATISHAAALHSHGDGPNFPLANAVQVQTALANLQGQIAALQIELAANAAAWTALAALAGPIVGAMFAPIAPPVAAATVVGAVAVVAGTVAGTATSLLIPTTTTSA